MKNGSYNAVLNIRTTSIIAKKKTSKSMVLLTELQIKNYSAVFNKITECISDKKTRQYNSSSEITVMARQQC